MLRKIREDLDLTQAALAAILHVTPHTISDWEREDILRPTRLVRVAGQLGVPPQVVDALLAAHQLHRHAVGADLPIPLAPNASTGLWAAATSISGVAHGSLLNTLLSAQAKADRAAAAANWTALSATAEVDRGFLIEFAPGVATWALVDRLAIESIAEAHAHPDKALLLARHALRCAAIAPASDALRRCLLGYSHAHIGNAHRVPGDLRAAKGAFLTARELWPEGTPAPAGLLSEARLFDLEASLHRAQRQFDKALVSVDRALALVATGPERGRLYLNQSAILEQRCDYEGSLEALRAAAPLLDFRAEPRLYGVLHFNVCANLAHLSRFDEALAILPTVREDYMARNQDFDLIRVLWLEGRLHRGLGHLEQAQSAFDQVWKRFNARHAAYDAALAGLDLAALYLDTGRNAETRELTLTMAAVFDALGIEREELAAVRLFVEAAKRETASVEQARRAAAAVRAAHRDRDPNDIQS